MTASMKYVPTIGLEIHIELATRSKMFCGCKNDSDETKPNTNVCPVCLGHPGTLPTINREAIENVIRLGYALHGSVAATSHFDRKSYFYPDLPKGYQISQFEEPLVRGGELCGIHIRRIHLEEDTGRLLHELPGGGKAEDASFVDFNRAGVPLMELVTDPDIRDGETAVRFARELQRVLRYLGLSGANMEKGEMRVEANISIAPEEESEGLSGEPVLGTKVEVKNLNSFRSVGDAIEYEIKRQERVLRGGNAVVQETRGWNEKQGETESQRSKESAHDYRYFPEPDLPPLILAELFDLASLKNGIPELPEEKRKRLQGDLGLSEEQAHFLSENAAAAAFFEASVSELQTMVDPAPITLLFNYYASDLQGLLKKKGTDSATTSVRPEHLAHLIALIHRKELSSRLAKDVLERMVETGEDLEAIIRDGGVRVMRDTDALKAVAKNILAQEPKAAEDFRNGKVNALQFLVGKGMAETKGQADPDELRSAFQELIGKR